MKAFIHPREDVYRCWAYDELMGNIKRIQYPISGRLIALWSNSKILRISAATAITIAISTIKELIQSGI